jgi:hypothetical protein
MEVTLKHDQYLTDYHQEWTERFAQELPPGGKNLIVTVIDRFLSYFYAWFLDDSSVFRCKLLPL